MSFSRTLAVATLMALLGTVSYATVTIPSNEALTKGDDARLGAKVTYSAEGLRMADVLAQLTQSTGVVMAAGLDKNDWMVYDRKVIVHVREMKLLDLMKELSSILRFHWSRGGEEGKWTYRLWQDKEQRGEEESLRASTEDVQSRALREKRENAIADMVNLGSLSEADAAKLKASDPWRYVLATEPLGRDVAEFINSFPEARGAFVQGQEASFPVASLPEGLQDTVRRIATSYDELTRSIGVSDDHSELLSRFERLQVTINRRSPGSGDDLYSRSLLGRLTIGSAVESLEVPLFDPRAPMAKAIGAAIVALKSGTDKVDVGKQLESDLRDAARAKQTPSDGSARDIVSDPVLRQRVKLYEDTSKTSLSAVLGAIAAKTNLNIISDCFAAPPIAFPGGERTLGEHLESVRTVFGSNWEKAGSTLRLRDTEWFRKRAWEVPQVWIDYWSAPSKLSDGLGFQDMLQIGCLRDEQIDHTILLDSRLVRAGAGDAARNRDILRFYGWLTDEQRAALGAGGLSVNSLSEEAWATLRKALATKGSAYAAAARADQVVTLTQSGSDVVEYVFTYHPGRGEPAVKFTMATGLTYRTADEVVFPEKSP